MNDLLCCKLTLACSAKKLLTYSSEQTLGLCTRAGSGSGDRSCSESERLLMNPLFGGDK